MFSRGKKKSTLCNQVDDKEAIVYDFRLRISRLFESYRPVDYIFYEKLEEDHMLPLLDKHLEQMISGEVDDGNGDMLIGLILSPTREAMANYELQQEKHRNTNYRLTARDEGDRDCIEGYRLLCAKELAALEDNHEKTLQAINDWKEDAK